MHWWAFAGLILAIMSYMGDLEWVQFPRTYVIPSLRGGSPTITTLVLFLIVFGILIRIFHKSKSKEKELLKEEIKGLKARIAELQK